mgnify:CR=1 FL=1
MDSMGFTKIGSSSSSYVNMHINTATHIHIQVYVVDDSEKWKDDDPG